MSEMVRLSCFIVVAGIDVGWVERSETQQIKHPALFLKVENALKG
jgi:hypothetical protein